MTAEALPVFLFGEAPVEPVAPRKPPRWPISERVCLFGLGIVILIGVAVRVAHMDQVMRTDESTTYIHFLLAPLPTAISYYPFPNNHLLNTLFEWFAVRLLGNDPWVIRLLAVSAGILIIPATYRAGRALYNPETGLLAAALVAGNEHLIEYSTNGRGYTVVALAALLLIVLAARLKRAPNRRLWLAYAVVSALGFYAIPVMLYPFGAITLWLGLSILVEARGWARWRRLGGLVMTTLLATGLTLLFYLPVFFNSGIEAVTGNEFVSQIRYENFVAGTPAFFDLVWRAWKLDIPEAILILLVGGAAIGLLFHLKIARATIPLQVALVVWMEGLYFWEQTIPFARVWLFALPPAFIFASAGITFPLRVFRRHRWRIVRPLVSLTVAAACIGLAAWMSIIVTDNHTVLLSPQTGVARYSEPLTRTLKNYLRPGDQLLVSERPVDIILYYFMRYDLPTDYVTMHQPEPTARLFVMVNTLYESLDDVLRKGQVNRADYLPPTLAKEYPLTQIYLFRQPPS